MAFHCLPAGDGGNPGTPTTTANPCLAREAVPEPRAPGSWKLSSGLGFPKHTMAGP